MMLDLSWKGSTSEVLRRISVGSDDPEPDSTWKAIASVLSLCFAGTVGSVRHFRVPCEANHIALVHSVGRQNALEAFVTWTGAKHHRPPLENVANFKQPQDPRRLLPELLGTAKESGHESRFRKPFR